MRFLESKSRTSEKLPVKKLQVVLPEVFGSRKEGRFGFRKTGWLLHLGEANSKARIAPRQGRKVSRVPVTRTFVLAELNCTKFGGCAARVKIWWFDDFGGL